MSLVGTIKYPESQLGPLLQNCRSASALIAPSIAGKAAVPAFQSQIAETHPFLQLRFPHLALPAKICNFLLQCLAVTWAGFFHVQRPSLLSPVFATDNLVVQHPGHLHSIRLRRISCRTTLRLARWIKVSGRPFRTMLRHGSHWIGFSGSSAPVPMLNVDSPTSTTTQVKPAR